jgi:hypothetical protein
MRSDDNHSRTNDMNSTMNRGARRAATATARATVKPAKIAKGYALVDGQARHAEHPASFPVPFAHEIAGVRAGDYVKVAVETAAEGGSGERFWTWVVERRGDALTALVSNHLIRTDEHGLALGDRLRFQARHVLDVQAMEAGDSRGLAADADADAIAANVQNVCPCCNGLLRGSAAVH